MGIGHALDFPMQQGAAVELRPMEPQDTYVLRSLLSHPKVRPHIMMRPEGVQPQPAYLDKLVLRMIYDRDPYALHAGIYLKSDKQGELAGTVSLQNWSRVEGRATLGYMIRPEYWGHGFATEAVALLLEYAIRELGLKEIEGRCRGDNVASERVMQKNGLVLKKTIPVVGSSADVMKVFTLLHN